MHLLSNCKFTFYQVLLVTIGMSSFNGCTYVINVWDEPSFHPGITGSNLRIIDTLGYNYTFNTSIQPAPPDFIRLAYTYLKDNIRSSV